MGAAIAAGSQEEKGTWALLVIKAQIIITLIIKKKNLFSIKFQSIKKNKKEIDRMKKTSPSRLIRKVSIPATLLL